MDSAKILVVDDEKFIRNFVQRALEREGHEVVVACSGEEGVAAFQKDVFDLVLSDVKMDDMDGIEMLSKIREIDATVVAIVVTAMRDQKTAVRALACGVQDFLIKPFVLEDLLDHVARGLEERARIVEDRMLIGNLMESRSVLQRQLLEQDKKLTQTEQYLNHLIDAAPFGVVSTDQASVILTFNGVAEQMYGYQRSEVLGRPLASVFGGILKSGSMVHQRKDNTELHVLVHKQDIVDENEKGIAYLYVLEDRSEREMLESQLFQAERLSLLGQMAPRIAHEFKTPLQLVSGNAELAQTWLEQDNPQLASETLKRIMPATQQLLYMVQQMTNLGKPEKKRQEPINLVHMIEEMLNTLQPLGVIKYCKVERAYACDDAQIFGDPSQIEQVIRNLVVNAAQAMEESEERVLTISVEEVQDQICVVVKDTGHGIPEEKLEEIFQPFYTTKPEGKGTGLGLAIVKSMLKRHQGDIEVESEEGVGTTFRLVLPTYQNKTYVPKLVGAK